MFFEGDEEFILIDGGFLNEGHPQLEEQVIYPVRCDGFHSWSAAEAAAEHKQVEVFDTHYYTVDDYDRGSWCKTGKVFDVAAVLAEMKKAIEEDEAEYAQMLNDLSKLRSRRRAGQSKFRSNKKRRTCKGTKRVRFFRLRRSEK